MGKWASCLAQQQFSEDMMWGAGEGTDHRPFQRLMGWESPAVWVSYKGFTDSAEAAEAGEMQSILNQLSLSTGDKNKCSLNFFSSCAKSFL